MSPTVQVDAQHPEVLFWSMEFLGHTLDAAGAKPLADKVDAVKTMPPPSTVEQLQALLGMINFY